MQQLAQKNRKSSYIIFTIHRTSTDRQSGSLKQRIPRPLHINITDKIVICQNVSQFPY